MLSLIMLCCCCDQQHHHMIGTLLAVSTNKPVDKGTMLPWVMKSKAVPIPEHTHKQKHMVLPVPKSRLSWHSCPWATACRVRVLLYYQELKMWGPVRSSFLSPFGQTRTRTGFLLWYNPAKPDWTEKKTGPKWFELQFCRNQFELMKTGLCAVFRYQDQL